MIYLRQCDYATGTNIKNDVAKIAERDFLNRLLVLFLRLKILMMKILVY